MAATSRGFDLRGVFDDVEDVDVDDDVDDDDDDDDGSVLLVVDFFFVGVTEESTAEIIASGVNCDVGGGTSSYASSL